MELDFGAATSQSLADAVEVEWINVAAREKVSRSRFRQAGIKPAAVSELLDEIRRSLGGPADAENFTRTALSLLGATVADTSDGFTARVDTLPLEVRNQLPKKKDHRLHFHWSFPVPPGHHVLSRVDPAVEALSRYVLDAALDPTLSPLLRPGRRAGVTRSAAVHKVTTLLVVRYRFEVSLPGSRKTHSGRRRRPLPGLHQRRRQRVMASRRSGRRTADHPTDEQRRRKPRSRPAVQGADPSARPAASPRTHRASQGPPACR